MANVLTPFQHCLVVCGLTPNQRAAIQREGFVTLDDYGFNTEKEVNEMIKRICALPPARGGAHIGQLHLKKMQALLFWIFDQKRQSLPLDHLAFDDDAIVDCIEKMNLDTLTADDDNIKSPGPLQTSTTGWIQWELAFENFLSGLKSKQMLPLSYVIRKDLPLNHIHVTEASRLLYQVPLVGQLYSADNNKVYRHLKECVVKTDGWEWIKAFDVQQDGRLSMQKLRSHYDGPAAISKRLALANQLIKELHYKNEQSFPFEAFITKLNGAYQVLAENGEGKTPRAKIEELLNKITCNNTDIRAAIGAIRMNSGFNNDFTLTVNKLSEAVTQIFPSQHNNRDRRRVSGVNHASGRGSNRGGRGRGRGGRGHGGGRGGRGPTIVNGVDISMPDRYYTADEWKKLPVETRKELYNKRKPRENQSDNNKRQVSGVQKHTDDMSTISKDPTSHTDANTSATTGQDGNDNNSAGNSFGRASYKKSRTSQVTTSNRRTISSISRISSVSGHNHIAYGHVSTTEIDNHADTHCFGKNFVPIYFTGQVCEVSPFTDTFAPIKNVQICTACTAYDDLETGLTTILEFPQGLWLADQLDHSLINPNQCRSYGISICDDPFDPYRELGIHDPETNISIPLSLESTIVLMRTRAPTQDEIKNCRRLIVMGNDEQWSPHDVTLIPQSQSQQEYKRIVSSVQLLDERPVCQDELILTNISAAYSDRCMLKHLVAEIRIPPARTVSSLTSKTRHSSITPDQLATKWRISIETARNTLKCTTQAGVRHAEHPLRRRYRTDLMLSRYKRLAVDFYSDTMFSQYKSLLGNTAAQIFANDNVVLMYPISSKSLAGNALQLFIDDIGIPNKMIVDGGKEQVGPNTEFAKTLRKVRCKLRQTEPYTSKQNRAEYYIGELKRRWRSTMLSRNVPKRLWDFGMIYQSEIMSRTARGSDQRTGLERITGETPDISEWLDFGFYDLVWYWDKPYSKDDSKKGTMGRWLGVSHYVGSAMCYWILTKKGTVIARTTVQHVTDLEAQTTDIKKMIDDLDIDIKERLNDENFIGVDPDTGMFYAEDILQENEHEMVENKIEEADNFTEDSYDEYLNAELLLPSGGQMTKGRVTKRLKSDDGTPVGVRNNNPLLDSREYVVELADGTQQEFAANIIAENLYSQCDTEGHQYMIFRGIVDHTKDNSAINKDDGYTTSKNGNRTPKKTTQGWKILIEWKDDTTTWVPLKDVKNSNPVELAEYAAANGLLEEPAFAWWANYTLNKRNRIISKVKSRYWKTTHKFGIRLPHSVAEALQIDKETGTDFWRRALEKEMKNVIPAFEEWIGSIEDARHGQHLVGFQEIKCHMIFDIKMENFTRKARFVAGGHTTETPVSATYSSVVSRDSVRIAFLVAALNGLDICTADVGNAYLNAECREKIYTIAGPEFGSDQGKVMIIRKALYGLKSSGAAWRALLATTLRDLGYKSSIADPDVWIKPAVKPNAFEYYDMILVYVDDILHISHDTKPLMDAIGNIYRLKEGSVGTPERYLGATISQYQLSDGRSAWAMSAREYLKAAIDTLETNLTRRDLKLRGGTKCPLPSGYKPELDVTDPLSEQESTEYQQLIGILRWACELGRIDILLEVSLMSSYNAYPREGHLEAVYHIFSYLKHHLNSTLVFDDFHPELNELAFVSPDDWLDFYPDATDELPPKMPEPRGNVVSTTCFHDANHAGNLVTRRSQTGFVIFVNKAPIIWFSKRQNTVESSTFGSEFVAARAALESVEALRYKLRMFGIPLDGPTNMLCDNRSVVLNSQRPHSTLNKKHNAICYHRVREAVAAGIIRVGKEGTETNLADLFTKVLTSIKRKFLLERLVY